MFKPSCYLSKYNDPNNGTRSAGGHYSFTTFKHVYKMPHDNEDSFGATANLKRFERLILRITSSASDEVLF
jgi:hypothetical protein